MKITGEQTIEAPPEAVWKALNDPEVLRQSIPGCKSLSQVNGTSYKATIETKIGPIKATFDGEVELSDLNPPHGYTLAGRGSAGPMGNAKGQAKVSLSPVGNGTKLTYDVDAEVTGKLAQLGSRLIQSTTGVLAGHFFKRFGEIVAGPKPVAAEEAAAAPSRPKWLWPAVAAAVVAAIILYFIFH
jgi:uncharacterized protein